MSIERWCAQVITALLIVIVVLCGFIWHAFAHDAQHLSDWIGDSRVTNRAGQLCCGVNDCQIIPEDDVEDRSDGVYIKSRNELIPYSEVQPSADGRTYRCQTAYDAQRRCFFRKYGGT